MKYLYHQRRFRSLKILNDCKNLTNQQERCQRLFVLSLGCVSLSKFSNQRTIFLLGNTHLLLVNLSYLLIRKCVQFFQFCFTQDSVVNTIRVNSEMNKIKQKFPNESSFLFPEQSTNKMDESSAVPNINMKDDPSVKLTIRLIMQGKVS